MSAGARHFVRHYGGHGRRANAEMSASMFLPTFAVACTVASGAAEALTA